MGPGHGQADKRPWDDFAFAKWPAARLVSFVEFDNGYWVVQLSPFALRFGENFGVRWYGLAYAAGFVIALYLLRLYRRKGRSPLDAEARASLLTAIVVGTLLGGRIGYMLFYRFGEWLQDPLAVLRVWDGGMASHGGILGIVVGLMWFTRWYNRRADLPSPTPKAAEASIPARVRFWQVADMVCTLGPPGVLLGRLANFINGELWGRISTVPWAMIFPRAQTYEHFEATQPFVEISTSEFSGLANPRHPSQLYEAALEGLVLGLYLHWRFWKGRATAGFAAHAPQGVRPGQLSGEFLIAYAVLRIIGEFFREPDAALILGMPRGMFYSLFMIVAGAGVIAWARRSPAIKP